MDSPKTAPTRYAVRCLAALAAGLFSGAARADLITPNSIPQPPPVVAPPIGSEQVNSPAYLVTTQYAGRGLLFPFAPASPGATFRHTAAIENFNGVAAWIPVTSSVDGSSLGIDDFSSLTVQLVRPGGTAPTTANSVTVELLYSAPILALEAFDRTGAVVGWTEAPAGLGPNGSALFSVNAANISSFQVFDTTSVIGAPDWGIAGIEFTPTPTTAPEPAALALAGVGALVLAGWSWRQRRVVPAT